MAGLNSVRARTMSAPEPRAFGGCNLWTEVSYREDTRLQTGRCWGEGAIMDNTFSGFADTTVSADSQTQHRIEAASVRSEDRCRLAQKATLSIFLSCVHLVEGVV